MSFQNEYEDYLVHHGVKGMRWGHRKSQHKDYADYQVKRDRSIYGDRVTRKINRKMHEGYSYSGARNAVGKSEYKKAKRLNKLAIATGILGVGGGVGGAYYANKHLGNVIDAQKIGVVDKRERKKALIGAGLALLGTAVAATAKKEIEETRDNKTKYRAYK